MDKQKQITEMEKIFCANCRKDGYSCSLYSSSDDWVCVQERERAEALYNAGYRKESDTAKEILHLIKSSEYVDSLKTISIWAVEKIFKERYGVEVE